MHEERNIPGLSPGMVSRIGHPLNEQTYVGAIIELSMCWRKVSESPEYN